MYQRRSFSLVPLLLALGIAGTCANGPDRALQSNDVVAFVGGADVASAQFSGHLETLLAVKWPGVRFRNFGWEGDTVFAQRRDWGFPSMDEHLRRAGVTVLFLQFGRAEALDATRSPQTFRTAYEQLALRHAKVVPRVLLVTPPPFEGSESPLPDLSQRNARLAEHVAIVRALASKHEWPLVDLFAGMPSGPRLTSDGLQFTTRGHAALAAVFDRHMGARVLASSFDSVDADGSWSDQRLERLRQVVLEKNRLWFNYWRPQNWAFLGGDRTSQLSSRDHRDAKIRWFPAEMEKYLPLIAQKEMEMEQLAAAVRGGAR